MYIPSKEIIKRLGRDRLKEFKYLNKVVFKDNKQVSAFTNPLIVKLLKTC